jgi:hypothetical protein
MYLPTFFVWIFNSWVFTLTEVLLGVIKCWEMRWVGHLLSSGVGGVVFIFGSFKRMWYVDVIGVGGRVM